MCRQLLVAVEHYAGNGTVTKLRQVWSTSLVCDTIGYKTLVSFYCGDM